MSAEEDGPRECVRDQRGRWVRGQSGNPNGRPARQRTRSMEALEKKLEEVAPAVIDAVVECATKGGSPGAQRLLLDRILPISRERPIRLPPALVEGKPVDVIRGILAAVAKGSVSVEDAASLTRILATEQELFQIEALERRFTALEKKIESLAAQRPHGRTL